MFQYISCYSLSIPTWLRSLTEISFNTSHVTLYLMPLSFQIKYLKCFNTSHVTLYQCGYVLATTVHGFQYISCYSLSKERKTRLTIPVSFNTSHVTLYPGGIQRSDYGLIVSIHLMLLFITKEL